MVLHNPNNWHWVNKDVAAWGRAYLEKELVGTSAEEGGVTARVEKVLSMDGDMDVSQRKGKVITLFDVKLQLEYTGSTKEEEKVSGTITIPEVAHDTEEDEYVFDIDIHAESSGKRPVKELVRTRLAPQIRKKLATLAPEIIASHSSDIQHAPGHKPAFTPAKVYSSSSVSGAGSSSSGGSGPTTTAPGGRVNVTTVTDSEEFRTSADQLYQTFTDPARLAAFTRGSVKVFEGAHVGGKFELFDGNVTGEYLELEAPARLAQRWRLRQWPAGHHSTLRIAFDQNDADAVTVMRVEWTGVPVGQEEVTKRNWREYYVRSIKTTFGFGTIL